MSLITVAYAAVAAGNLLLRLTGQPELPGYLDVGIDVLDRIVSMTRRGRENAGRRSVIEAALPEQEFAAADAGDIEAADRAVAQVLSSVPAGDQLIAAVRDPHRLHELLAKRATLEETQLLSEPAQAVFRMILAASEAYIVKTALDSENLVNLAHRQELRDLADLAGDLHVLADRLSRVPAETVQLLAGEVLQLQPPVTPRRRPVEPSRLLAPTSGVFPFVDRGGLLESLVDWADDPAAFSVKIMGGLGGSGKSRLAVELSRQLLARGNYWRAGFLGLEGLTTGIPALCTMPGGRLIVMDYAETRTLDVANVLTSLHTSATSLEPVRVLLLVRNPAVDPSGTPPQAENPTPWVKALRAPRQEAANDLLDEATCILLDTDSLAVADRVRLFTDAIARLPEYVGQHAADVSPGGVESGFLERPEFAQPLYVAMAAYLHVAGRLEVEGGPVGLFEGVLEHEAAYWEVTAALPRIALDLTEPEHRLLVAFATLTDAIDDFEALQLLGEIRFLSGDSNALRLGRAVAWLRQLYPAHDASLWGQLLPDRLGEYLVATQLANQPELIGSVLGVERNPAQWVRPLRTLTRACTEYESLSAIVIALLDAQLVEWCQRCRDLASTPDPWSSAAAIEALASLIDVVGSRCNVERLVSSSQLLGLGNRLTASLCLAVDRAAVQATEAGPDEAVRAEALNNYAISLAEVGQRDEALAPAREAVDLRRSLAKANPAAYTPALAMSLNNYAVRLAEVGQRDEAIAPAREALDLRRSLAKANPAAYTPDLAMSLNNYAVQLAEVRQRDEALAPAREAVDAYRVLAQSNPAAYTPALASSLNNYAVRLAEVGQRDEALAPAREAVDLRRSLAKANPAAYTPALAMSLNNYANVLAEVGQRDEALAPAREAVDAYRVLAQSNPAAYTPALASSLNNYAVRLAEVGQRDEALAPAREAVDLRRSLAKANPAAYTPALAMSLNNYANVLAEVGQRDEALAPAREAVDAYRVLAQSNPAAYTPALAMSLNNYAVRLAEVGQRDEALAPAREAVDAYRVLAQSNPAAYTPALASSLNNYAVRLAEVGQRDEALAPAREAVDLRRVLAQGNAVEA